MPEAMKKMQHLASVGSGFVLGHHILFLIQVLTQANLPVSSLEPSYPTLHAYFCSKSLSILILITLLFF